MARNFALVAILAATFLASCASFSEKRQAVVEPAAHGDYDAALAALDKLQSRKPGLLDLCDRGTLLHFKGDYAPSNQIFHQAEDTVEYLAAESVSREAATYLVNDLTQAYGGEEYEKVWLHIMLAFNYMLQGNLEEALVEIRRIDRDLQVYADRYGGSWKFKNHAFAHYLSGLLHETVGELNDAHISYRKALAGYQDYERYYGVRTPFMLQTDFLRSAKIMGFTDEFRQYEVRLREASAEVSRLQNLKPKEVIFLIAIGKIAHKEERFWEFLGPGSGLLRAAYPAYVATPYNVRFAEIEYNGKIIRSILVEDLSSIAGKTLADRMTLIESKAVARMLLKAGAAAAAGVVVAKETNNPGLGALTAVFTDLLLGQTERADTRSWLTLPGEIHFARLPLKAGLKQRLSLKVHYKGQRGEILSTETLNLDIDQELKTFVFLRAKEP